MNKNIIAKKAEAVNLISEELNNSQSYVVVESRGLTVAQVTQLRRDIAKQGGKLTVYKNNLVSRAAKSKGYEMDDILVGPNAFVSATNDPVSVPNLLVKFAKKNKNLVIKGGIVENKVVNADEMKAIAALPTKPVLISMLLGCLQSPLTKFAYVAKEVATQKENA